MRRKRPSDLYQVDFVAALFGGFLLLWLARSTAPAQEPPPPIVTLGGELELTSTLRLALAPSGWAAMGCAEPEIVAIAPGAIKPCAMANVWQHLLDDSTDVKRISIDTVASRIANFGSITSIDAAAEAFRKQPRIAIEFELEMLDAKHQLMDLQFAGLAFLNNAVRAVGLGSVNAPDAVRIRSGTPMGVVAFVPCEAIGMHSDSNPPSALCALTDPEWSETDRILRIHLSSRQWGTRCAQAPARDFLHVNGVALTTAACIGWASS